MTTNHVVSPDPKRSLSGTIEPQVVFSSPEKSVVESKVDRVNVTPSSLYKSFLAGTSSGVCTALLFQPLDVLKTRIQSSINKGQGAVGLRRTFMNIVRHERVLVLWNGVGPSIVRCVPGMGIYFSTIHLLSTQYSQDRHPNTVRSLCMGATARSASVIMVLPFTVLKTRFECGEFNYKNMRIALTSIYAIEGLAGLYSGLTATLLRDAPFSALYYAFYQQFKAVAKREIGREDLSAQTHFLCGLFAGLVASATTQPADVIKTHIQMYPQKFTRLKFTLRHILQNDGWMGFFRGLSARMMRRTLVAASAWTVYERIMTAYGLKT